MVAVVVAPLAHAAQSLHQSSILKMGADLQCFKRIVTCDLRCSCRGFAQNIMLQLHKLNFGFDCS